MELRSFIAFVLYSFLLFSMNAQIKFIENEGQFPTQVFAKLALNAGDIYFEDGIIKFSIYDKGQITDLHHNVKTSNTIKGHNYNVVYNEANDCKITYANKLSAYYNYYIGKDTSKWASNVPLYSDLIYKEIYNGIDLHYYSSYGQLKYDFIVAPAADPKNISWYYEGVDYKIRRGHIILETNLGKVIEQSPYAYQLIEGEEVRLECKFVQEGTKLGFELGSYDHSLPLIIDPILVFGTYTGSTSDNWGYTATYDDNENMFVGGVAFGTGYPTTIGAFDIVYGGGTGLGYPGTDVSISKFSDDGSQLLYSTYVGGTGQENPHSMVCNTNGDLYVFGSTSSSDFPVTASSASSSFSGGTAYSSGVFNYPSGVDGYVVKLNSTGTALLGSTYFGGTGNDVLNLGAGTRFNYGDTYRGEIIVDINDNCWIATSTLSNDVAIVNGFQTANAGGLDALALKFNSDLSSVLWSTYYGGTSEDAAFSIQLTLLNEVLITGGTKSNDLFMVGSSYQSSNSGGADGFVLKINSAGSSIIGSSYLGTPSDDLSYFVQVGVNDNIYLYGQTKSPAYPITSGTYSNSGSGQFIHCLSPDLSSTQFSTVFGSGNGINISPSAFSVTDCNFIYVSGWGGATNANAAGGSTFGMPLTPDAYQSSTDGSDFYIGVFAPNASSLLYGTYFGGGTSHEHVDGGTSRFDKKGNVYQAVCAGCGGNSDFPTTSGSWSTTNNSTNCNLGAFKFALDDIHPVISIPQPWVCIPSSYTFFNNSQGGNVYSWDFGDGDTSNLYEPTHTYTDTGGYEITLIVSDSLGCLLPDTTTIHLDVFAVNNAVIQGVTDTICSSDSIQLFASGGATYHWSPGYLLSDSTVANPWAYPDTTTIFTVTAHDSCGNDVTQVVVHVYNEIISTLPDTTICFGAIVTLEAYGGVAYNWYPTTGMINPGNPSPNVAPINDITYIVDVTTPLGCILTDSVNVNVITDVPTPSISDDITICTGDSIVLEASGGEFYVWSPDSDFSLINDSTISTSPVDTTYYEVEYINSCGSVYDTVWVNVVDIYSYSSPDTTICPGDTVVIWASGGEDYNWVSGYNIIPVNETALVFPYQSQTYDVIVTNEYGCSKLESIYVGVYPIPDVSAGPDYAITFGQSVVLQGQTSQTEFIWTPNDSLSCVDCIQPTASPTESVNYVLTVSDTNGCVNSDTMSITLDGVLYVPNTFTPNGDNVNDLFEIKGKEIKSFELWIFNRWGELIYHSTDMNDSWDGTFRGSPVQIDAYVWKLIYEDYQNNYGNLIGHVNVIR